MVSAFFWNGGSNIYWNIELLKRKKIAAFEIMDELKNCYILKSIGNELY